jgi:hypothetical protein
MISFPARSLMGWEQLEVVDPNAESAAKGQTKDEGLNIQVSGKA